MEGLGFRFAFLFSPCAADFFWLPVQIALGNGVLSLSADTPCRVEENGESKLVLYGYAVDVLAPDHDWCTETMRLAGSAEEVMERSSRLGGKYILFLAWHGNVWCMGDATGSAPVFWHEDGRCASYIPLLGPLEEDAETKAIRDSGDCAQAMPFDITQYRQVRQLLPNHALNATERHICRITAPCGEEVLSAEQAARRTAPMILNLLRMYSGQFPLACPITSGRDSRIVLAAMNRLLGSCRFPCYTISHNGQSSFDRQDVLIPEQMGRDGLIDHAAVPDEQIPKDILKAVENILGRGNYSENTAMIAWTIHSHLNHRGILTGDIMGQVGKCSLHRGIPETLATPGYFRCKLHNYSGKAKKYLRMWIKDAQNTPEQMNLFDLFSVENRLGRWAAQENQMYDLLGVPYFNLFNCREIIDAFSAVPRHVRADGKLHEALLKELDASLMRLPYGKDRPYERLARSNWLFFWLATWIKHLLGWFRFRLTGGFNS